MSRWWLSAAVQCTGKRSRTKGDRDILLPPLDLWKHPFASGDVRNGGVDVKDSVVEVGVGVGASASAEKAVPLL